MRAWALVCLAVLVVIPAARAEPSTLTLRWGERARIEDGVVALGPRAFAVVDRGTDGFACMNALEVDVRIRTDGPFALEAPTDMMCSDDDGRFTCRGGDHVVVACARQNPQVKSDAVYVADFEGDDVEPALVQLVTRLFAGEIAQLPRVRVLSAIDVREMTGVENDRALLGCSESGSCIAALQRAIAVRALVTGRVARAERAVLVDVTATDVQGATVLSRVRVEARDVEDLARRAPLAAHNLWIPISGAAPRALPPPDLGRRTGDPEALTGAAIAGGAVAATGLLILVPVMSGCFGLFVVPPLVLVPCIGCLPSLALVGVAGLAGSAWGDAQAGYPVDWRRAGLSCAAGACATTTSVVLAGLAAMMIPGIVNFANPDITFRAAWPAGATVVVVGTGLGALIGGAATAATYEATIAWLGDGPSTTVATDATSASAAPPTGGGDVAY